MKVFCRCMTQRLARSQKQDETKLRRLQSLNISSKFFAFDFVLPITHLKSED